MSLVFHRFWIKHRSACEKCLKTDLTYVRMRITICRELGGKFPSYILNYIKLYIYLYIKSNVFSIEIPLVKSFEICKVGGLNEKTFPCSLAGIPLLWECYRVCLHVHPSSWNPGEVCCFCGCWSLFLLYLVLDVVVVAAAAAITCAVHFIIIIFHCCGMCNLFSISSVSRWQITVPAVHASQTV